MLEHSPWSAVFDNTARAAAGRRVALAHDSTECRFGGQKRRDGLGRMSKHDQGFVAMMALAIDRDRPERVLGVASALRHVRDEAPRSAQSRAAAARDPSRESQLWPQSVHAARAALGSAPASVLHLFDAGADDYALLAQLLAAREAFVVRGTQERCTDAVGAGGQALRLTEALEATAVALAEREVPLSARAAKRTHDRKQVRLARAARTAKLQVRAATVTICRPAQAGAALPKALTLNVVQVREVDAPAGETPVEWRLWTSEPVASAEQALAVVDAYLLRWKIEELFFAIKTGCAFEKRQLESLEALWVALAFFSPVAVQLMNLRAQQQVAAHTPAEQVVDRALIEVARTMEPKVLCEPRPSVEAFLKAVARLGGHLSHNGPPGWRVLMRGFEDLALAAVGWNAALEFFAAQATKKSDQS